MNLLGIDLKPLLDQMSSWRKDQQQIIALLQENNKFQKLILSQLGG